MSVAPAPVATPVQPPVQDPQLLTRLAPEPPTNVRAEPAPRAERSQTRTAQARTERAPARAERAPVQAAAPVAAATPAPLPDAVAPAGNTDIAMTPADTTPVDAYAPLPVTEPAMAEPPAPVEESTGLAAILAGLLAIAVAGIGAFLVIGALRRRRQRMEDIEEPVRYEVQREPSAPRRRLSETLRTQEAVAPASVSPAFVPTATTLAATGKLETPRPFVAKRVAPVSSVPPPAAPASFASQASSAPAPLPEDPQKREALIEQIVEADPDPVIPFQSRKARRKRARLILQSLQRGFENARPNFDIAKFCRDWNIAPPRRFSPA